MHLPCIRHASNLYLSCPLPASFAGRRANRPREGWICGRNAPCPGDQTINKTFDELSRLTGIELVEADGVTTEDIVTFGYDALGQKTSAVDGDSNLAWTYDGANRVAAAETVAGPLNLQPATVLTHAYDAVGNRLGLTHGPDGVIVDGAWSYLHDGNGNLTRVTTPATEMVDLVYDAASRLERIT